MFLSKPQQARKEAMEGGCQASKDPDGQRDIECAICYDEVAQQVDLPCRCQVSYCHRCWDHAMAQSYTANGRSRCPTCRSAVRVDFDANRGVLLFSHEDEDLRQDQLAEHAEATTDRLAHQSSPMQARILQQYGEARPLLRQLAEKPSNALAEVTLLDLKRHIENLNGSTVGCLERRDLVERLQEAAGRQEVLVAYWAAVGESGATQPLCVCGSTLRRVAGKERSLQWARKLAPNVPENSPMFRDFVCRLTQNYTSTGVLCDICDAKVPYTAFVWTCENGDSTILHAMSYDVCDHCFASKACPGLSSSDSD